MKMVINMKIKLFSLKILMLFISMLAFIGFFACNSADNLVDLEVLESPIVYTVGDNVDVFDLFSYKEDQVYSFKYIFENKTIDVEGETIYLAKRGEYSITATASKGEITKSATTDITVVDGLATMSVKNTDIVVGFEDTMSVRSLIGRASISTSIKADYSFYVESVIINKSDKEIITYDLVSKPPTPGIDDSVVYNSTPDGFFNGKTFNFIYECDYVFTIASITSGGVVNKTLNVKVVESFAGLTPLDGLTFSKETLTATWNSVAGATSYRVKVGNQAKIITETTFNISELLPLKSMHISGYYVDVEYNRNNGQIKTIFDDDWSVVKVQCDLIIHSRGEIVAQDNLIAIEMKKDYRDEEDCETDRKRLRALTKSTYNNDIWSFDGETFPEHVCRYILGIFYFIDERKHLIKLEYYRNGKIESKKVIRLLKQ